MSRPSIVIHQASLPEEDEPPYTNSPVIGSRRQLEEFEQQSYTNSPVLGRKLPEIEFHQQENYTNITPSMLNSSRVNIPHQPGKLSTYDTM